MKAKKNLSWKDKRRRLAILMKNWEIVKLTLTGLVTLSG